MKRTTEANVSAERAAIAMEKLQAAFTELTIATDKARAVLEKGFCRFSTDYEAEVRRWLKSRQAVKR